MALSGVRSSWDMLARNSDFPPLQLLEEPDVFDRDPRLIGERCEESNLLVRERTYLSAVECDRADQSVLLELVGSAEARGIQQQRPKDWLQIG